MQVQRSALQSQDHISSTSKSATNYRGHITSGHIWHTQRGDSRRVCAVISTKYTVGFKEGVGGMMVSGLELLACV